MEGPVPGAMAGMVMSSAGGLALFLSGWTAMMMAMMMMAMMIPATLPLILLYRTIARKRSGPA
jgi:predicted metal-binding membrane protein